MSWGSWTTAATARRVVAAMVIVTACAAVILALAPAPDRVAPSTETGVLARATIPVTTPVAVPDGGVASPLGFVPSTRDRYSLAHGCFALQSSTGRPLASADGPFRLQPAALGVYLFYTPAGRFLDAGLEPSATPSAASEWTITGAGGRFRMDNATVGGPLAVRLIPAQGCATFPEAGIDAAGRPLAGASPESDVLGTVDGHAHITAFEFFGGDWHCGRPFSPFGVTFALPYSCDAEEQGTNGAFEQLLDFGGAPRPSRFNGWPVFDGWPTPTTLAEEGDYYTGIERAWLAGLRLLVSNDVDNEALCSVMTTRTNSCNDMESAALQSKDLYALQDYVDAQSGGPGRGWFRIVTNPFQARQVINQGKLAVIQGIEVSALFNCTETNGDNHCSDRQIDDGIKQVTSWGVRTFFPVHEFDNAFGGTKGIAGTSGLIVNSGNRKETGAYWNMQSCSARDQDAEQTSAPASGPLAGLINSDLVAGLTGGAPLPVYSPGPTCNTRGITEYGRYLVAQMIKQHLIIQTDHMDSKTAAATIAQATAAHYAGVVSAHCCGSPQLYKAIYHTGGALTEATAPGDSFLATMKTDAGDADPAYRFGFGWGSDMNGLGTQPGPASATPIRYPFRSFLGDVTFGQERWGRRTFDLNRDGLANYGMYADFLSELQTAGGPAVMRPMFQGAEAWLEMWERAAGVPVAGCAEPARRFSADGLGSRFRLDDSPERGLYRAGQPLDRPGRAFRFCAGAHGGRVVTVFGATGRSVLELTNVPGVRAGAVAVGSRIRSLASGVNVRGRYVYVVRGGRVSLAGVAARALSAHVADVSAAVAAARI